MHHALEIQEILLNVFHHSRQTSLQPRNDLASLARTCHAFHEPAMDVLWEQLNDLSILAKCLSEASSYTGTDHGYSFHRSLTRTEWDVLYSCTRRIRTLSLGYVYGLAPESLKMLAKPPMTETLFPNVHHLFYHHYNEKETSLLLFSFPSLVSFEVVLHESHLFRNSVESFAKTSPRLTRLFIDHYFDVGIHEIYPSFLCQWQNLQTVEWSQARLDLTSLAHLSRMPALIELSFTLVESLPDQIFLSDPPLVFTNLRELQVFSESSYPLSQFLSRMLLCAITKFTVSIKCCPSKRDLALFFTSLQTSGMGHTIKDLHFAQNYLFHDTCVPPGDRPVLYMEDLEPCMAFSHLCSIYFDVEYQVDLTESDLFRLTSAWLHLGALFINPDWGWNSRGGLTPNGLLQFVQASPSLTQMAIVIDTRGYTYTELSPSLEPSLGLTPLPRLPYINVVDSFIDAASVPAITAFFATFKDPTVSLWHSWYRWPMQTSPHVRVCEALWEEVCERVNSTAMGPSE